MKFLHYLSIGILALSLAACSEQEGKDEGDKSEAVVANGENIKFTDAVGKEHQFTKAPESIATLNPGIMDILLELDANVVGRPTITDEMSDEVKKIQDIGNPHEPSFEQIVALKPEVLIAPISFQNYADTITATGIEVVYEDINSIAEIQDTITRYGELFGNEEKAETLNKEINEAKGKSVESKQNALIVYGAPGTYLAALDNSLYGDILNTAGGNNIASNLPELDKYPTFANLSAEKIVESNPQVILLITHSDPDTVKSGFEKQMNQNPAWKNLDAVKNNKIIIAPSKLFDNPGTQVVEALDYMRDVLGKSGK